MVAVGPTTDLGELGGLVLCGGATPGTRKLWWLSSQRQPDRKEWEAVLRWQAFDT